MHVTQIDNRRIKHAQAVMHRCAFEIWDLMHPGTQVQQVQKSKAYISKRAEMLSAVAKIKFLRDEQSARLARKLRRVEWNGVKAKDCFYVPGGNGTSNGQQYYNWISRRNTFGYDNHLYINVGIL